MHPVSFSHASWKKFVAVAERQNQDPEVLAQSVLEEYVRKFHDEELIEASSRTARRASFHMEETEEVVRVFRGKKKK